MFPQSKNNLRTNPAIPKGVLYLTLLVNVAALHTAIIAGEPGPPDLSARRTVDLPARSRAGGEERVLFRESFDDDRLLERGWYDGRTFKISGQGTYAGSGCIEYHWKPDTTSPDSSSGVRHLFAPTDTVLLRFYIKLSKGWGWTGRSYHPHLSHFMTTENSAYHGPASSHLTLYIEPQEGMLRLGATDMQNADMPHGLTQGPLRGGYNGMLYDSQEVLFTDAKWHCVEAMFKLNSLDVEKDKPNADGIVRGWFDGKLVVDRNDVIFRTTDFPNMKFNQFLLTPYFGPGLLPHEQTLWIDELVVATERTGSLAAKGPLRVHPTNPRYFTDGTGRAIYLTGSHTWGNLCDSHERRSTFDFTAYLDFLERHHHNFIRLWSGDGLGHQPVPYARTGPGTAKDGGLAVDLDRFDPAFFDRLRSRVVAAQDRGVYVGIMLFSPDSGAKREDWDDLLYHPSNNVQAINADTNKDGSGAEAYDLSIPRITAYQEAFVRKVVDTVNDLDNVLYEIGNEGDLTSVPWQYHFIRFIKRYESGRPKQHPVGMTGVFNILNGTWATDNRVLFESPADWISPGLDPYKDNPPAADGTKVIIADVDHIWPTPPHRSWIWECFLRGIQPILMDWYCYGDPKWTSRAEQEAMRKHMGYARTYAMKMNLAAMTPRNELAGTGYCLANPGKEYLVYQPRAGEAFSVELKPGSYRFEWFNPSEGATAGEGRIESRGCAQQFKAPFAGDAVLYLKAQSK